MRAMGRSHSSREYLWYGVVEKIEERVRTVMVFENRGSVTGWIA